MNPKFIKHAVITLKTNPAFSEKWLQGLIADDPTILGLGDLELIDRERVQERSGRLDLLLSDGDSVRYEVELMLGATDPAHIIRCIEYWDTECRRYPGYEHIAVLIAEDITSRFLNVMSLMAGNIPLIAIQLSALQIEDKLALNFVKVLDQTSLRRDDSGEGETEEVARTYWENRVGTSILAIADGIASIVHSFGGGSYELRYVRSHLRISEGGDWRNFAVIWPRKQYIHLRLSFADREEWLSRIEEAGLPVAKARQDGLRITINPEEYAKQETLLREVIKASLEYGRSNA